MVVERLPLRAGDRPARELAALRAQWRRDPADADAAVALAMAYIEQAGAEGDPRYVGYAQAALQRWWNEADAAGGGARAARRGAAVRPPVRRGAGRPGAAVKADPDDARGLGLAHRDPPRARRLPAAARACERLAPLAPALLAAACRAQVDALTGRAAAAAHRCAAALQAHGDDDPAQRLWALTRLAEIEERRGDAAAAERAFRDALALQRARRLPAGGVCRLPARPAAAPREVLTLLKDDARADVLLLRLALAAKAARDARAPRWRASWRRASTPRARAATARTRRRSRASRSRCRATPSARCGWRAGNYAVQREAADARILLEAAIAARQRAAAEPVLQWLRREPRRERRRCTRWRRKLKGAK